MSATLKTLFRTFKLSFRRRAPSPPANQYPLSLTGAEWVALKELLSSPGWAAYRALLENYANLRAQRLLQPLSLDATNVERGAVAALLEIAALPETLVQHVEALDARRHKLAADDSSDLTWRWGNPLFADDFTRSNGGSSRHP